VVAVVNMKGGVGKTTLSANLFESLFRRKRKRTLLVDFDPQYNLTQLLLREQRYATLKAAGKTIWNVMSPPDPISIFQVAESDLAAVKPVADYVSSLKYFPNARSVSLDLLAGDFELNNLNLREDAGSLRLTRLRFANFMRAARLEYELIVLDCNPSSSFITRSAVEAATHLLVPVRADKFSLLGLEMLTRYVDRLPGMEHVPKTLILLNDLGRDGASADVVRQLRGHDDYGPLTLVSDIRHSESLRAKSDYSGFAVDRRRSHVSKLQAMLDAAADEIAEKVGLV
jgi:chromosome partitioning protein